MWSLGRLLLIAFHVKQNMISILCYFFQDDLIGKSIYNVIHVGDHIQFSSSLLPMSVAGSSLQWASDAQGSKSRTFNCRMLLKPSSELGFVGYYLVFSMNLSVI